ncbi:MAG: DUF2721 domain-containing protein [Polymorphobacter sp.]
MALVPLPVDNIAHNIQLAVAPVFLLTGIGSLLNVLTARLNRIIDRVRAVEAGYQGLDPEARFNASSELHILDRRLSSVQGAIALCTLSALLVCLVVAILFVGDFVPVTPSTLIAALFIGAMGLLIAGLVFFLLEIRIATRSVRVNQALLVTRRGTEAVPPPLQ